MAERAGGRMAEAAFRTWTEAREERWELVDGVPRMMAGAGRGHDRIVVNVLRLLAVQLAGRPCEPVSGDTVIRIPGGNDRMRDAGVDCGAPDDAERAAAAARLVVVVEVLSPSTGVRSVRPGGGVCARAVDRSRPADRPDAAQVTLRSRDGGWSERSVTELGRAVVIASPGLVLPLAEIDERVGVARPRLVT